MKMRDTRLPTTAVITPTVSASTTNICIAVMYVCAYTDILFSIDVSCQNV
jgi:hypothetical protein